MPKQKIFGSFTEFWPFYLGEHLDPFSRALHYLGTISSNILLVILIWQQQWYWLPIVLLIGYAPAWFGHFIIEKNRPATFQYPIWSLRGDYKMLYLAIRGKIQDELKRLPDNNSN